MTYSCSGFSSILLVLLATLLSITGFFLPMWALNGDFIAGVWSYRGPLGGSLYFGTENVSPPSNYVEAVNALHSVGSVCGRYSIVSDMDSSWAEEAYAYVEGAFTGVEDASIYEFVGKTCTGLGGATLAFSILGWISGLFAFLFLLCGVSCCSKKSCLVVGGKVFTAFACLSCFLACILWAAQSNPLRGVDGINYGVSFYLYIAAFILFAASLGLVVLHAIQKRRISSLDASDATTFPLIVSNRGGVAISL